MRQPRPTENNRTPIADILIQRIQDRKLAGIKEYGTPLQAFNGRNPLQDAIEEAIDLAKYLTQAIEEKTETEDAIANLLHRWESWQASEDKVEAYLELEDAIARLKKLFGKELVDDQ